MKYTVLDMTQSILSAMDSDEVTSINDTVEALQVAECIRTTYNSMVSRFNLPANNQLIHLSQSDATTPTLMTMVDGVQRMDWLKYFDSNQLDGVSSQFSHDLNLDLTTSSWSTTSVTSNTIATGAHTFTVASSVLTAFAGQAVMMTSGVNFMAGTVTSYVGTTLIVSVSTIVGSGTYSTWVIESTDGASAPPGFLDVYPLSSYDFITYVSQLNPLDSNVGSFILTREQFATGSSGDFTFYFKTDIQPKYYTVISNQYVIFDSYDSTQETYLQNTKTLASAWLMPAFQKTDTFTPVLDEQQFPYLLQESKALAFAELKQMPHQKAEIEVRRQTTALQKYKSIVDKPTYFEQLPNFGRNSLGYPRTSRFNYSHGRPNT